MRVWDAVSGELLKTLPVPSAAQVRFSPDGHQLVAATHDRLLAWSADTWSLTGDVARQAFITPSAIAFTPDSRAVLHASTSVSLQLLDTSDFQTRATFEAHDKQAVAHMAFTSDGRRLVTCVGRNIVHIWDLQAVERCLNDLGLTWDFAHAPSAMLEAGTP